MTDLNGYIKNNRKFYKFKDKEIATFIYKGFKVVPDRFNPEGETVIYNLQYPDSDKTVMWQNKSTKVAEQMATVGVGEVIQIERVGDGLKTVYNIHTEI